MLCSPVAAGGVQFFHTLGWSHWRGSRRCTWWALCSDKAPPTVEEGFRAKRSSRELLLRVQAREEGHRASLDSEGIRARLADPLNGRLEPPKHSFQARGRD